MPTLPLINTGKCKSGLSQVCGARKKLEFKPVLWASSFPILLTQGHFLLVLVNDFVSQDNLPAGPLAIGQVSHGSYNLEKVLNFSSRLEKTLNSV